MDAVRIVAELSSVPVPEDLCSMCLEPTGERYSLVFPRSKRAARELGAVARFGRCCWPKVCWSLDRGHYTVIEFAEERKRA
jgi:hypothetical protein